MLEVRVYHKESDSFSGYLETDNFGSDFTTVLNNTTPCNYLTFDGKGVNLIDENLKFYEDNEYRGYTLPYRSNENCEIDVDYQEASIWINLAPSLDNYPERLTIQFKDNCCKEIKVMYCNATGLPVTQDTISVTGKFVTITFLRNYYRIYVCFTKTVEPHQYIRIESVIYGAINVFDKFKSHNLIEEINVLSDDLPINQFEASIVNPDHIELAKKDPLVVFSNNKYYGSFYITNIRRSAKDIYDITAQNAISILDSEPFNTWEQGAENFNAILQRVKSTTGIDINFETNSEYMISGNLKQPTCRMVLCAAGFAIGFMVDSSRSDDISLIPIPTEISNTILTSDRRIIGDAILTRSDEISNATIKYVAVSNTLGAEKEEPSSLEIEIIPNAVNVYTFNEPVYIENIKTNNTNIDIIYANLYSVCFKANTNSNTATITYYKSRVMETDENISNESAVVTNNKEYKDLPVKAWYSDDLPVSDYIYDPIFVANISRAADVKKYIQSRGKVNAKIRLRKERVGDLIQIETAWDGIITGIITKMNITSGYEDIADIEVLEWNS